MILKEIYIKSVLNNPNWCRIGEVVFSKHFGKLVGGMADIRHCHLTRGKPTYVCCWEVVDKQKKIIEVNYVGTHEKAPY